MKRNALNALFLVSLFALSGCGPTLTTAEPATLEPRSAVPLPSPILVGETSIEETLTKRRSVREFADASLSLAELGQLLWATQGITSDRGFRTAPSAGALYPLELYVSTADGIFHYDPEGHRLLSAGNQDVRQALYEAALRQEAIRQAPAVFVLAAVYERIEQRYGSERGPRYVHMEAGHAAQNLLLEAVALDLGAVPIGAFQDEQVQDVLELPADQQPLYLIPVGRSGSGGP
jgi:SagB-type dehydrogenase family enzyme